MDIEAVRMFVMLAEKLNFTETSRLLQISQPTLSRKIKALEDNLMVTLIHRRGGHISLTPQGETFLAESVRLLKQIDRTIELVQSEKQDESGPIRVGCLHPMAKFLTDNFIFKFNQKFPHIAVHFKTMIPQTLNSFEEVDIMIAPFLPQDDSIVAKQLPRFRRYCYASPCYLAEFGTPTSIEELGNHQCVTQTNAVSNQRFWKLENMDGSQKEIQVDGLMSADSVDVTIDLVKQGFGIGMISRHKALEDVESGKLVSLFDGEWFMEGHMYLMYKQNAHMPKRFKMFIDEVTRIYSALPLV